MYDFTHIKIESKAFPLGEDFSSNCDEAARQERIARCGLDLLAALHGLLHVTERPLSAETIDRAICAAHDAYQRATGQKVRY
jgi:hypothetical protein